MPHQGSPTQYLCEARRGSSVAASRLNDSIYSQLKVQAAAIFRREASGHTLQPTALVSEAYLRMIDQTGVESKDRTHFMATAARIMRHILIDHARAKGAAKRGGNLRRLSITIAVDASVQDSGELTPVDLLSLNDALEQLAQKDQRCAGIVEMRYFGGLTDVEIGEHFGISGRMVRKEWVWAREWLRQLIGDPNE